MLFESQQSVAATNKESVKRETAEKQLPLQKKTVKILKSGDGLSVDVVVVAFALIFGRSEVVENADGRIGQSHIVPQLLALVNAQRRNGLAFYDNIALAQKVHIVLVRQWLPVIRYLKRMLFGKRDLLFFQRYFQRLLIDILVQPRPQLPMDFLTTAYNVVGV